MMLCFFRLNKKLINFRFSIVCIHALIIAISAIFLMPAFALDINNTSINDTRVKNNILANDNNSQVKIESDSAQALAIKNAKIWHISVDDWHRYQDYMQSQGKYYYKGLRLSPVDILAVTADTPAQMKKYTDIEVQLEHARLQKELAQNVMFQQESKRLYPNEQPLNAQMMASFSQSRAGSQAQSGLSLQANDELLLFAPQSNLLNYSTVHTLINEIKATPETTLSIYIIGKDISVSDLQNWASANQVPVNLVNAGRIHINSGNDKYNPKVNHEPLPLVVLKRGNTLKKIKNI